ncbi:MAG: hypothetical protein NC037_01970 [Bacteroides sp.]|nr:hypothetical protein [Bacillota bacterium]MCM1393484.1 hypothetical protein [[Eubacterium] siraeum]MCM1455282.1 hypothetical protein [Bacteroides sp.]
MTQQDRQFKKVKLYRVLKVVFYCLGLPLFVAAVFLASIRFIGNDPFTGNSLAAQQLGAFYDINKLFTSPALYGVWIALGIWLLIAIVHIILSKTVKSRRVRALSVTALTMVVMLGCLFVMDAALGAKIDKIAEEAPSTVTVQDYKTLLSYYRTISSYAHKNNLTEKLIDQVNLLEDVYHIEWEGVDKTGVAGSIENKPVTYYNIIADDGTEGVDISFKTTNGIAELDYSGSNGNYTFKGTDGKSKEVEGNQVVRLAPSKNGSLTINDKTYSHYFAQERTYSLNGKNYSIYTWYTKDMKPTSWREGDDASQAKYRENGVYGEGLYSQNGLLSDGWIFSFENVLEILEDYYEAKEAIENGNPTYYANAYAQMYESAYKRRETYYNGANADPWLKTLYNQRVDLTERFSMTRGELEELIARLGALLGDNSLFDYLFGHADDILEGIGGGEDGGFISDLLQNVGFLGGSLGNFFKRLSNGFPLSEFGLNSGTLSTVADILSTLTGKQFDYVDDLYLTLAYKSEDGFGVKHDNLYLAIARGMGEWRYVESGESVPLTRVGNNTWVYTADLGSDGIIDNFATTEVDGKLYENGTDLEVEYVVSQGANQSDVYLDIDFNGAILGSEQVVDPVTGEVTTNTKYAFDLDTLSAFLNDGLNNLLDKYVSADTVGTILNLVSTLNILKTVEVDGVQYYGLSVLGIEIPLINVQTNKVDIDINGILYNLLQTLYSYQSAVIKPVWEFYVNENWGNKAHPSYIAWQDYAKYERALYTATIYGSMIGSTLVGDNLGTGAYPSSLGLTDLASVQQLKVDLSYQRDFFPLFAVRDMIALFAGIVILFYFISFIAAQREEDYATGKLTVRDRKAEKETKKEAEVIAEFDENLGGVSENGEAPPEGENEQTEENSAEEKVDGTADDKADEKADAQAENSEENSSNETVAADGQKLSEEASSDQIKSDGEEAPKSEEPVSDSDEPVAQEDKGEAPEVPVDEKSDEEVL